MATRIVEGKKPYTGGTAITVDDDKVISLNLRAENNLIIYDAGDDEIYVDLQLPDGIKPIDAFPVGITTGRVLVADDWDVTGTLICAKTTSGDNIKILYGDDNKLYMDNGTGTFRQVYFADEVDAIIQLIWDYLDENLNTKTFRLANRTDLEIGQDILDRYNNGGNPIIMYSNRCYFLLKKEGSYLRFRSSYFQSSENPNESDTNILVSDLDLNFNEYDEIISIIDISGDSLGLRPYLATNKDYGQNVYQPLYDGSPATKKYVDDAVSTMVGSVYKYKGSVQTYNDLPNAQSVNPPQEGDVWNIEQAHTTAPEFPAGTNVAWTGTAWDPLSGMMDLSSYYTSTQVNTLLAGKQNTLTASTGISINNDTISNTLPGPVKSTTAPSNPNAGDQWYDTSTETLYYYDSTQQDWVEVGSGAGGGDVLVSTQANNIFTPGMKIWGGTESDYQSLTPDSNTAYLLLAGGPTPWQPGANTIAYYELNGDATDATGNYDGIASNVIYTTLTSGIDVATFNGSNSKISIADPLINNLSTFTVNVWFNDTGNNFGNVLNNQSNDTNGMLMDSIDGTQFRVGLGGGSASDFSLTLNTWHNVVLVYNNGDYMVYLDNQQLYTETFTYRNGTNMTIGCRSQAQDRFWTGYISKVIFEDKARTEKEKSDYFNQTKGDYGIS